ncbi:hypothetical protein [Glycomyces sp. MUSA5-2]|uniref:hypothetical protein n=1 Tax=Glycomyces sp. MUSA5-2 TaxID=2053002 RepID=UPI00300B37D5
MQLTLRGQRLPADLERPEFRFLIEQNTTIFPKLVNKDQSITSDFSGGANHICFRSEQVIWTSDSLASHPKLMSQGCDSWSPVLLQFGEPSALHGLI